MYCTGSGRDYEGEPLKNSRNETLNAALRVRSVEPSGNEM
jgi:hypothetical protein